MFRSRRRTAWLGGAALAAALGAAPAAYAQVTYDFDLPAQGLADALQAVARRTGANVVFDPQVVAGRRAPALSGAYSAEAALHRLLADAGLSLRVTPGGSFVVTADVAAEAPASIELAELVVTGSRLGLSAEGPARVTVLGQDAIRRSGAAQVRDVLRLLPQASTGFDESGATSFLGATPPQLRGLSAGSTLLLLNGRRLNVSGSQFAGNFFDLNQLPLAAVDRVEVLTDTATAVYGADAVGGAINLILRPDFQGVEATGRVGTSAEGDATERQGSLLLGASGDRASGMLIGSWFSRDAVRSAARDLTANSDFSRFGGPDLRSGLAYPGTVYSLDGGPLPGLAAAFAGVPDNPSGRRLAPSDFAATAERVNLFEPAPYTTLAPETERGSLYASGRVELPHGLEAYGELLYSNVKQTVQLAPDALFGGALGLFVVSAANPYNPFGVDVGIDHRFVDLGPRTNEADTDFTRALVGVRGELPGGFDFDLAYWRDQDDTKVLNRNYLDYAAVFEALASPDPARALNVFTTGGNSAAVLDAIRGDRLDRMNSESESAELVLRGDLFRLPGGPLRLAFGANLRDERIDVDVPGTLAVAGGRKSSAVFLETRAPLIGEEQGAPLVHGLDLTVAVRHDRFSGDVETTNPQYGVLWRLTPDFSLRATYGEAFKIPSLYNLYAPSLTLAQVVSDPRRGGEAADIIQRVGGNPDVQPETAEAWTVGFGWTPSGGWLDGLELSASLFHIEQSNFVQAAFDVDLVLNNPEIFAGRVQRATPTAADTAAGRPGRLLSVDTRSGNFGSVTVRGLDADLSYRWGSERWGDFGLQVMASYIDRYDLSLVPGAPSENVVDIANGSGFPVDLKLTSVLSWDGGDGFGASLTARYRDSYADFDGQRELPAQTVFDLQVSYAAPADGPLPKGLRARAGVINLTDEQGDFAASFTGYDPAQTEMRGRYYYLELSRRF